MKKRDRIKLYVFVDERGQHVNAGYFVVVAVVTAQELSQLRQILQDLEKETGVYRKKWKKTRSKNRLKFLKQAMLRHTGKGEIFFGAYKKPIPFFFPLIEVIEKSIKLAADRKYIARVTVDGIDRKKSAELTNALRVRGISLAHVRGYRDESEVILRLADRWAGCIGVGMEKRGEERRLCTQAVKDGYLKKLSN